MKQVSHVTQEKLVKNKGNQHVHHELHKQLVQFMLRDHERFPLIFRQLMKRTRT